MFLGILAALALTVGTVESINLTEQERQLTLPSAPSVSQVETAEIGYLDFSE